MMTNDSMYPLRILFISRAFPPIIGGIEKQNAEIYNSLKQAADVTLVVNRHGKRFLPFFLPYALVYTLCRAQKYDVVLLGDGVLSVLALAVRLVRRRPVVFCTLHGLDLTFPGVLYQKWWVRRFLPRVDMLLPVSRQTAMEAVRRGLSADRCRVVPNGVDPRMFSLKPDFGRLQQLMGRDIQGKLVLLSVGRLVQRKGVHWFIEKVLPRLPDDVVYVVAGDGPMRGRIEEAVARENLGARVCLLGRVSSKDLQALYASADIFIQPNIPVENDMEGFGLVVLEAGAAGLPVVASRLEGLADAISDGDNGQLLPPGDADAYVTKIQELARDGAARRDMGRHAQAYVRRHFPWEVIAERYLKVFQEYRRGAG